MDRARVLQSRLWEFQQTERFVDLTIEIGDRSYPCHRVLLASCPGYFQHLLAQKFRESLENETRIRVRASDPQQLFPHFLKYIYTGDLTFVNANNALAVYVLAVYLQLPEVHERAASFFANVSKEVCLQWIGFLAQARDIRATLLPDSFILSMVGYFFKLSDNQTFMQVPDGILMRVLTHPDLRIASDFELAKFIVRRHEGNRFGAAQCERLSRLVCWGMIEDREWDQLPNWQDFISAETRDLLFCEAAYFRMGKLWTPVTRASYIMHRIESDPSQPGLDRYSPPLVRRFEEKDNVFDDPTKFRLDGTPLDKTAKELKIIPRENGAVCLTSLCFVTSGTKGVQQVCITFGYIDGTCSRPQSFLPGNTGKSWTYTIPFSRPKLCRIIDVRFSGGDMANFAIVSAQASGFVVDPTPPRR